MSDTGQTTKTTTDQHEPEKNVQSDYSHLPIDHGWAYVTVFGCFGVCALVVGTVKSFGVILVELSRRFNVPASVLIGPQCLAGFFHLSLGPVANALSERYSHRLVVFVGGLVATIGLVSTSFVQSVPAFYVTYGVLSGVGFGLCLSPSITFQGFHFRKRRALANGLSGSGAGAGAFALPPVIRVLINYYGLGGCLLLVGGFMFNTCVFCSLYRPPSYWTLLNRAKRKVDSKAKDEENLHLDRDTTLPLLVKTNGFHSESADDKSDNRVRSDTNPDERNRDTQQEALYSQPPLNQEQSLHVKLLNLKLNETDHHLSTSSLPCITGKQISVGGITRQRTESVRVGSAQQSKALTSNDLAKSFLFASVESFPSLTGSRLFHTDIQEHNGHAPVDESEEIVNTKKNRILEWSLLKSPTYLVFIFAIFTGVMGQHSLFNILPPVVNEMGISDEQGAVVVSVLGAADLIGRIFFGWLADFGFIQRQTMYQINLMLFALIGFIVPHVTSFIGFCLLSMLLGFFSGGYTGIQVAVLADKVGVDKLSSAWGFAAFFASLALLVNPMLAGMIRDVTGSWLGALRLGAGVAAFGSGSLIVEVVLNRLRR
ncbi:monocarboxylate transporter 12-like [Mizuhopecten yessoensis]|uniref:monocarboxylate transporter 12-like n=1 Tax=Mizuhopecten yessoensis TaxID=6573 RepID=UPI000B45C717|nr:monocarboxylate transporter 12-like [Mizuhopecten yessoensis]